MAKTVYYCHTQENKKSEARELELVNENVGTTVQFTQKVEKTGPRTVFIL
jgi:hypothetical protein